MSISKNKRNGIKSKIASTFRKATGGGWGNSPESVSTKDNPYNDYVDEILKKMKEYSDEIYSEQGCDSELEYTLDEIPMGITHPNEIVLPLFLKAGEYGLRVTFVCNENIRFTRI